MALVSSTARATCEQHIAKQTILAYETVFWEVRVACTMGIAVFGIPVLAHIMNATLVMVLIG